MLCEYCGNYEATIHVNEIAGNSVKVLHLCEDCAHEQGISFEAESGVDLTALVQKLTSANLEASASTEGETMESDQDASEAPENECPRCGSSLADIQKTGRFGCPDCYRTFRDALKPVLKELHQGTSHDSTDSESDKDSEQSETENEEEPQPACSIEKQDSAVTPAVTETALREKLKEAIEQEDYERAAELRDQIHSQAHLQK